MRYWIIHHKREFSAGSVLEEVKICFTVCTLSCLGLNLCKPVDLILSSFSCHNRSFSSHNLRTQSEFALWGNIPLFLEEPSRAFMKWLPGELPYSVMSHASTFFKLHQLYTSVGSSRSLKNELFRGIMGFSSLCAIYWLANGLPEGGAREPE